MEIIYEAFNFFKTNGFVHLPHLITMSNDLDMENLYCFYNKEKDNKEIINFMDHYQNEYGLKTTKKQGITYKIGTLSNGECIICYDENKTGLKTPCNHFMCIECCAKLFQHDKAIKKCPYCREDVSLYGMNELISKFKNEKVEKVENNINNIIHEDISRPREIFNHIRPRSNLMGRRGNYSTRSENISTGINISNIDELFRRIQPIIKQEQKQSKIDNTKINNQRRGRR